MDILVSINCLAYNHERTISDAIESFLMQNTSFNFEILIGEDCSTDNTRKKISEYIDKYPGKIRMITSDLNVGPWENTKRLYENSKGKYIAICEGDDYWIDPNKLEKQAKYMEENEECTLCFHNAETILANGKRTNKKMIQNTSDKSKFNAGEISLLGFVPTASFFFRKDCLENPPEWYYNSVVGDLPLLLITTSKGYAYYINEVMSYYRVGQLNSAAGKLLGKSDLEKIKFSNGVIDILKNFNNYTDGIYEDYLLDLITKKEFNILITEMNFKELQTGKYKHLYDSLGLIGKFKIIFRYLFPRLYSFVVIMKYRYRYILPSK